jgi:hypothetical protein
MYGEFKGVFHLPISGYWYQLIPEKHHCRDTCLRNLFFFIFYFRDKYLPLSENRFGLNGKKELKPVDKIRTGGGSP